MVIAESLIYLLLGLLLGIFLTSLLFFYFNKKRTLEIAKSVKELLEEKERMIEYLEKEKAELKDSLEEALKERESLKVENGTLKEKLSEQKELKERMKIEFENLANSILQRESERLEKEGIKNIDFLIKPLQEEIKNFSYRVEEESKERFSLIKEIERLRELNVKLSEEANNLAEALKGNSQAQGAWGEMILQKILEESGLREGREYESQFSITSKENKRFRPDVIVRLPKNRAVVIDSKVSLVAYERYFHAKDERERQKALEEHMNSIYTHLKELSQKRYEELLDESLDFVLMFIPIEGAFLTALKEDPKMFIKAQKENIIIVSPTTLLATLRTIENIWRHEYQNQNAKMIAKKAGDLYDKFVNFIESLQNIGTSLDKAQNSYEEALKRLSEGKGNLLKKAMELKNMEGVKSTKEIPKNFLERVKEE